MNLKVKHRQALADLGLTVTNYYIDYGGRVRADHETDGCPEIWGMQLTHSDKRRKPLFIEHHADQYGGNWRWYLRTKQGDKASTVATRKTQREILADTVRFIYAL